ncbi:MAG: cytochrome c biogenesis protein CcsA [Phycisphaerales bacterium]
MTIVKLVRTLVVVCIALAAGLARADDSLSSSAAASPTFAQRVDLTPLGRVAVHAEGRLKSLGSHANTFMQFVSGPRKIAGQDPLFTYIDMMLRPEAYDDADIIYVKNRQVREQIASTVEQAHPDLADRMKAFRATGLTSPAILRGQELVPVFRTLEADLVRTAKQMDELRSAQAVADARFLLSKLLMVPPAGGRFEDRWHGIEEVMFVPGKTPGSDRLALIAAPREGVDPSKGVEGLDPALQSNVADAWRTLVNAWLAQDAPGVTAASTQLAELLPKLASGSDIYPDQSRLSWEYWYFQKDQLTSGWLVYMGSVILLLLGLVYRWPWARRLGIAVFLVAFAIQTFALMLRWYIAARWPNSNMFEAVTTASWFGACAAIVIEILVRKSPMRSLFFLGSAAASMVALMTAHFLPVYLNPNISNMMPVLHDVWLYIHTNVIIFSYCLIFMAAVSATCYVVWRAIGGGGAVYARVGGAGSLVLAGGPPTKSGAARSAPMLGEVLDGVTMVLMELSFVLLWAGIVMGAIWADHSWGRPWGWDPKEVFALNTFVVFALLVHVRLKVKDKGLWTAILAIGGAGVMLFNWIVINFIITGLHSYA